MPGPPRRRPSELSPLNRAASAPGGKPASPFEVRKPFLRHAAEASEGPEADKILETEEATQVEAHR